jgi:hypothetical protein
VNEGVEKTLGGEQKLRDLRESCIEQTLDFGDLGVGDRREVCPLRHDQAKAYAARCRSGSHRCLEADVLIEIPGTSRYRRLVILNTRAEQFSFKPRSHA